LISKISRLTLQTKKELEFIDITNIIKEKVKKLKIQKGNVTIFSPHTTCSIKINEFETNLFLDFVSFLNELAPKIRSYSHNLTCIDGRSNAHSHLLSLLLNTSETIPILKGELLLGEWQKIFFIELDGPRKERRYLIHILGE
jgi:secondary thiamine-phosphate synthase enzyme